jgi:hypothetical protein
MPGMASAPTPTNHPNTPPITTPVVAPAAVPLWHFFDSKILCPLIIPKQDRHVRITKAFRAERIDGIFNVRLSLIDPKCCCILPDIYNSL